MANSFLWKQFFYPASLSSSGRGFLLRATNPSCLPILVILALSLVVGLPGVHSLQARAHAQVGVAYRGLYWFQVGAMATSNYGYANHFGIPVTGASVEIRVLSDQKLKYPDSDFAYWIGINLPNDAFIQVGYLVDRYDNQGQPTWFWEYFLPGTASEGNGVFLGKIGSVVGPNGTWVKFSLTSSGSKWSAYVNQQQVGSIDLGLSNSTVGPYASAEAAEVSETDNVLGPVEFRNLAYRDTDLTWHMAEAATALCCYSSGSDRLVGLTYPYGVAGIPGDNNHWLAGSKLPYAPEGQPLWPWYRVSVNSPYGNASGSGWHVFGDIVDPIATKDVSIAQTERYHLTGWNANGIPSDSTEFTVTENLTLTAIYTHQFLVTISSPFGKSTGSGWYDAGSPAAISVTTSASAPGLLGQLGVRTVFEHWSGDHSGSEARSTVFVDSPKSIHAVWSYDYGILFPLVVLISGGIVTALAIIYRHRIELGVGRLQDGLGRRLGRKPRRTRRQRSRNWSTRARRN
jgi:hypothetical protein